MHHYDAWGWYTAAELPGRATDAGPPTTSETTTPGQPRANWQGSEWAVWPYVAPPVEAPPAQPVPDGNTKALFRTLKQRTGNMARQHLARKIFSLAVPYF